DARHHSCALGPPTELRVEYIESRRLEWRNRSSDQRAGNHQERDPDRQRLRHEDRNERDGHREVAKRADLQAAREDPAIDQVVAETPPEQDAGESSDA